MHGVHERWGEKVDELNEFTLEGGFINIMDHSTSPGVYEVTFLNVVNPTAKMLIEQSLKYRTHLQNVPASEQDKSTQPKTMPYHATSRLPDR